MKMSLSEFDELIKSNDGLITFSNCCAIGDSPAGIGHYYVYKPFQYLDEGKEVDFESALRFYNRNIKVAKVINENELAYYEARLKGEMDMGGRGSGSGKASGGASRASTASDKTARILNSLSTNKEKEALLRKYDEGTEVTIQQNANQAVYTKTYGNYWESQTGERVSTRTLVSIATVNTKKTRSRFVRVIEA